MTRPTPYYLRNSNSPGNADIYVNYYDNANDLPVAGVWCGTCNTPPISNDFSIARLDPKNRTGIGGEDLLSRNFNWSLPVLGLAGRSGLDLGLALTYNSLVWTKNQSGTSIKFNADNGFPSPGFQLGFP